MGGRRRMRDAVGQVRGGLGRVARLGVRQVQRDRGAAPEGAVDVERAAVALGHHAGDGEPQAHPLARLTGREERRHGLPRHVVGHALAVVDDRDAASGDAAAVGTAQLEDDGRVGLGGVARVRQQIDERRLQLIAVDDDRAAVAQAQFEPLIGPERILEFGHPGGHQLMDFPLREARRRGLREGLELAGEPRAAVDRGPDGSHRAVRIVARRQAIEAAGQYLEQVGQLVRHDRGHAAQGVELPLGSETAARGVGHVCTKRHVRRRFVRRLGHRKGDLSALRGRDIRSRLARAVDRALYKASEMPQVWAP